MSLYDVLEVLRETGGATSVEIVRRLGCRRNVVIGDLIRLREKGLVRRVRLHPRAPRTPLYRWEVAE